MPIAKFPVIQRLRVRDPLQCHWIAGHHGGSTRSGALAAGRETAVNGGEAAVMVLTSLFSSASHARLQAQKAVSAQNMRNVGMAMFTHAEMNQGAFPPDLATLLRNNTVTLEQFRNPYTGETPSDPSRMDRDGYLIYRSGLNVRSHPGEVILAERTPQDDGANFLLIDGHVEFIAEPRASELIGLLLQGAESIRP